jgi:hypothetical protein
MLTSAKNGKQNGDTRTRKPEPGYLYYLSLMLDLPVCFCLVFSGKGRCPLPSANTVVSQDPLDDSWLTVWQSTINPLSASTLPLMSKIVWR